MSNNYRIGRIGTIFVYLLEGLVTIIFSIWVRHLDTSLVAHFAALWAIGAGVLFVLRSAKNTVRIVYYMCEILFISIVSCWITEVFGNPHILFLALFLQWMCNLLFLKKIILRTVAGVHVIVLSVFSFAAGRFNVWEYVCAIICLLSIWFFSEKLVDIVEKQSEVNADHEQSLDDMLSLVEVKFEEARQANNAKSTFLANMSHEIRTPINTVLGLDTMILRECKDPDIRKYAINIQGAGHSLLSIINDILDFSKIESGKMEIIPVDYDLSSVINDVTNMIIVKAEDKGLAFHVNVDNSIPSRLYGDDVRIRQILVNLLTNAVKYTNRGSVTLTVNGTTEGNIFKMYCSVRDTGIGIKPEDKAKLFDEFVRIEEKRNRNIEGTGLGINIVTQLLNLMGSKLQVSSIYGEGSDFSFVLEQEITNKEPIGNLEDRIREQAVDYDYEVSYAIPDASLLVVDDNPMNRLVFRELLKGLQCEIVEAESGAQCLELVKEHRYDIVFMDHMMPEMDGIETFHAMQNMPENLCADVPVIVLTANAVSGAKEMYMAEGFTGFLSKPVEPEKLEKMIYSLLPKHMLVEVEKTEAPIKPAETNAAAETFPKIEGVDWNYALLHLPSEEMLKETVKAFYMSIDTEADYLSEMYSRIVANAEDVEAMDLFRIRIHAMKSSATLIGILPLAGTAAMLEFAARDGERELVIEVTPHFVEKLRGFKQKLKPVVVGEDQSDKTEITDKTVVIEYLEQLISTSMDFDVYGADTALENLRGYAFPADLDELLERIAGAVVNLDADNVKIMCEDMMGKINERF